MLHRHASPAVAGSYAAGAVLGALTTATALFVASGLLSLVAAELRAGAAVCALSFLVLHATRVLCLDFLPQRRHQIPRETFTASPCHAAFRFAYELGTGVRTYITAAAPYALAMVLLLCLPASFGASAFAIVAAALGYGIGRSLVVAAQSWRNSIAVEHPPQWLQAADILAATVALVIAIQVLV